MSDPGGVTAPAHSQRLGPTLRRSAVVVIVLLPLVGNDLNKFRFTVALLYIVTAIGMDVALGYGGQFFIGQAVVMAVAAYTAGWTAVRWELEPLVALPMCLALGTLVGVLLALPGLRTKGFYLAIVSFFATAIIPNVATLFNSVTGGSDGLRNVPAFSLLGATPGRTGLYLTALAVAMIWYVVLGRFVRSGWRLRLCGLRDAPHAVESVGLSLRNAKLVAYVFASAPAATAGWMLAYLNRLVEPNTFGINLLLLLLAAVELGGRGTLRGPVLGAVALTGYGFLVGFTSEWNTVGLGLVLMFVSVMFPSGLIGTLNQMDRRAVRRSGNDEASGALSKPSGRIVDALPASNGSVADQPVLQVRELRKSFAGQVVLDDVTISLGSREIVGLVGANGSGKTTLLNIVTGMVEADAGTIEFGGGSVDRFGPERLAQSGLSRTFQVPQLIPHLSARENVELGLLRAIPATVTGAVFGTRLGRSARRAKARREQSLAICGALGLSPSVAAMPVSQLPLGIHRIVELGRAVATGARLLCLDEPAAGLAEQEINELGKVLQEVRDSGRTVLLIEHHIGFVLETCDRVALLESGRVAVVADNRDGAALMAEPIRDYVESLGALVGIDPAGAAARATHTSEQPL